MCVIQVKPDEASIDEFERITPPVITAMPAERRPSVSTNGSNPVPELQAIRTPNECGNSHDRLNNQTSKGGRGRPRGGRGGRGRPRNVRIREHAEDDGEYHSGDAGHSSGLVCHIKT